MTVTGKRIPSESEVEPNPQQTLFVEEFLKDFNATRAAEAAGYDPKSARTASQILMRKPHVRKAIMKRVQVIGKRIEVSVENTLLEFARIGFANLADMMVIAEDGLPRWDFSQLTREQMTAIQEITIDTYFDGTKVTVKDEDGEEREIPREVKRVKVKMHSKTEALVNLAKFLRMYQALSAEEENGSTIVIEGGLPEPAQLTHATQDQG